jgi:hypothetical protein
LRVVALASLRISRADVQAIAVTLLPCILISVVPIAVAVVATVISIISIIATLVTVIPISAIPPLSLSA